MQFSELNATEQPYFADSREGIGACARTVGRNWPPETVLEGIETLQLICDRKLYQTVRHYQALSICLGDLMGMTSPFRWVHVEHKGDGGPVLRWKETDIALNVLITFEQRVLAGKPIEVRTMFREFVDKALEIEKANGR